MKLLSQPLERPLSPRIPLSHGEVQDMPTPGEGKLIGLEGKAAVALLQKFCRGVSRDNLSQLRNESKAVLRESIVSCPVLSCAGIWVPPHPF